MNEDIIEKSRKAETMAIEALKSMDVMSYIQYESELRYFLAVEGLSEAQRTKIAECLCRVFFSCANYFIEKQNINGAEKYLNELRGLHSDFPGSFEISLRLMAGMVGYLALLFESLEFGRNEALVPELMQLSAENTADEEYARLCQAALVNLINLCPYSNTTYTNLTVGGDMAPIIDRMGEICEKHPENAMINLAQIRALVTFCAVANMMPTEDYLRKYNENIPKKYTDLLWRKINDKEYLISETELAELKSEIRKQKLFDDYFKKYGVYIEAIEEKGQCNTKDGREISPAPENHFPEPELEDRKKHEELERADIERLAGLRLMLHQSRNCISAGDCYTVGLKKDGTVLACGYNESGEYDTRSWRDIVAISTRRDHVAGLKLDGTVLATGCNEYGKCDTSDWRDIVSVSAGMKHTIGVKSDGGVVVAGYAVDIKQITQDWRHIKEACASDYHTVGLKSDGAVIAAGRNEHGQCDTEGWSDIVAVAAGVYHTVGLKSNGRVVAVGANSDGQCNTQDWRDIIAVSAGTFNTIGLKADRTVIAAGFNNKGQCDIDDWCDIIAISAGIFHTAGLKPDGTLVAVGYNRYGECDVRDWREIGPR